MLLRIATFLLALFALVLFASGSPVPINGTESGSLEKRITHTGRGTWYYPGLGNCGYTDTQYDAVVAIAKSRYGDGGNCNQWIQIKNLANGKTVYGKTRDSCPGCGDADLDMSPAVFEQIGNLDTGVLSISWHFMSKGFSP